MARKNFPQQVKKFEIEAYKKPEDLKELRKTHVPFSGAPHKHPYDPKKIGASGFPVGRNGRFSTLFSLVISQISFQFRLP